MTSISLEIPSTGEKNTIAEPKVGNSIKKVEEFINGNNIDGTTNIKAASIKESNLEVALQEKFAAAVSFVQKTTTSSETIAAGECVGIAKSGITLTLPTPTKNRQCLVYAGATFSGKIKCSSGKLYGDFTNAATEVELLELQHLWVIADGTNWLIMAGEPKRTATPSAFASIAAEEEVTPSATRPALITLYIGSKLKFTTAVLVGGVTIAAPELAKAVSETEPGSLTVTFQVNPGQKFKLKVNTGTVELAEYSKLLL